MDQTPSTASLKKQRLKSIIIGIVVTVGVALLGSLLLRFFGIDVFRYVGSWQIQDFFRVLLGGETY